MFSEADKHQLYDELHDRLGEHAGGMLFTVVAHVERLDGLWRAEIAGVRAEMAELRGHMAKLEGHMAKLEGGMAKLEGGTAKLEGGMKAQFWKYLAANFATMLTLSGLLIGSMHFA